MKWIGIDKGSNFHDRGNGIAWNGNTWVAVGEGQYSIVYSNNGITNWDGVYNSSSNIFTSGYDVAWNGTYWLAIGNGVNSMAISYTTFTWQGVSGNTTIISNSGNGGGVAWNAGRGGVFMNPITLNEYGSGLTNKLDIVCDKYYNTGYSNFTLTIK